MIPKIDNKKTLESVNPKGGSLKRSTKLASLTETEQKPEDTNN